MKKLITFVLIVCSFMAYSQTVLDTTMNQNGVIEINILENVNSFSINGKVELTGPNALIRVVLELTDGRELLVYETNSLLANSNSFDFINEGEETSGFSEGKLSKLKIDIVDAKLSLNSYSTKYSSNKKNLSKEELLKTKINQINANLKKQGALWVAGETSVSKMTYSEKKKLLEVDVLPNLQGLEYYKGGIIDMRMYSNNIKKEAAVTASEQYVPWADEFSYIDLHGANDPGSTYYNSDTTEQGWITAVKDQGLAGACWAFSAVASLEARANLYYNQHLHLNLSEQQLLSCSKQGTTYGGQTDAALQWTAVYGSVNEECFPYQAADLDSSLICTSPQESIKPEGVVWYNNYDYIAHEGGLKRMLINKSPVSINVSTWQHALLLVGYKTLNIGSEILLPKDGNIQNGLDTLFIADTSAILGQTSWKIKNSWGSDWGDHGFFEMIFDDYAPIYRSSVPAGKLSSLNLSDADIACLDSDGDGFYNWGVGDRPAHCPNTKLPDGDDNNANYGPHDEYGNLSLIGELAGVSINGNEIIGASAIYNLVGLPSGAVFSHWSYSSNLSSDNYQANELTVSVKVNNGLASLIAHFTYNNKKYKITKTVSTGDNQIIFVEQKNSLPPAVTSTFAIADFDMDEDYDLVYSGMASYDYAKWIEGGGHASQDDYFCYYFENNNGLIRDTSKIPYTGGQNQFMDINDLNNDLKPDFSIIANIGYNSDPNNKYHRIFYSGGILFADSIADIVSYGINDQIAKLTWADIDNDGILDVGDACYSLSVFNTTNEKRQSYHVENENYLRVYSFGDFDNDGKIEPVSIPWTIFNPNEYADQLNPDDAFLVLFDDIDNEKDSLVQLSQVKIEIPDLAYSYYVDGDMGFADFNNDGFLDILVSHARALNGAAAGGALTIYLNNQPNGFSPNPIRVSTDNDDALGVQTHAIGDFNNDNYCDILYSGYSNFDSDIRRLYLLVNDGTGKFTSQKLNIGGVENNSSLNVADFDSDGNLDFLISGANGLYMTCGAGKTEIMLNKSSIPNLQTPIAPTNLTLIDTIKGQYLFNWDKLSDGGYSYNIKIGTTPGGGEIVSCNALMNGKLTTPKMGQAGLSGIYLLKRDLPVGTYYWSVQAIDNAYRGGEFAAEQTFTIEKVNEAPVIEDQIFTIEENLANGSVVGIVLASDVDSDALSYSITTGNSTSTFSIDNSTGEISVNDNTAIDYETNPSFILSVAVSDGLLSNNANVTINITDIVETSISKTSENTIGVRPNPASEFVVFETGKKTNVWVVIFNFQGQMVISQNLSENNKVLVKELMNGIYMCRIIDDGNISTQKLLIQK